MQTKRLILQEKKCIYRAIIVAVILFCVCSALIVLLRFSVIQRAILEITDRYMTFESKVERLIYANVTLLQGFEAYIASDPDLDEEKAYRYLDNLLSENSEYVRNIGIIENTTILWNYPRATNAAAIGVDLSTIEGQRDSVLKVKEQLTPIFQGPIDLVQGGTGFSVRIPIIRDGIGYWGQTSIILKTEKILEEIRSYADSAELDVAIFNQQNRSVPFFGTENTNGNSVLVFEVDPSFINWTVHVNTHADAYGNLLMLVLMIVAAGVSVLGGLFTYKYLKSNYKILNMSTRDFLTGLYNRHFLDEFQTIELAAAKREHRKAAIIMIDLNHFKEINDMHGHNVGDMVLVETARILLSVTRANEAAFRLGGDEFLLVLPVIDNPASLGALIKRIQQQFEGELLIPGHHIRVTPGIGYAVYPDEGDDFDTLLRVADKRMYQEKRGM